MRTLLKDIYSKEFYNNLSETLEEAVPAFDKAKFFNLIFDEKWQVKELKDRMRHSSFVLSHFMPGDFQKAAQYIEKIIIVLREKRRSETGIEFMFLPDYIENYGINDFETSVELMEFVTKFTSCEFAVRPFIIKYGDKMLEQMQQWSLHENLHVRRLASEGSRPRLPWAMAIPDLKKDPSPILPILANLKSDPSEYVRRSVANNLNDIAKDHPQIVIEIARQWKGNSKETDAIIKHGCRTLLKQGNIQVFEHFGLNDGSKIELVNFKILTPKVQIDEGLEFSFSIRNNSEKPQRVRLEYAVYYLRQKGQFSKKVFKISERTFGAWQVVDTKRNQSFRLITTRKFYAGAHKLSLIINGREKAISEFELAECEIPSQASFKAV